MDVHVQQIATEVEPLDMSDFMYTVGSGSITEGVDELILGLKAGEELKLNGNVGGGRRRDLRAEAEEGARARVLPELSDEWVQENTEWQSEEEMRDTIFDQMRRRRVIEAQMTQRDAVLVALSEPCERRSRSPTSLVHDETNERLHDLGHRLGQQKLNLETFLQVTNQTSDQLLESLRADAHARGAHRPGPARAGARRRPRADRRRDRRGAATTTAESMNVTRRTCCAPTCATPGASSRFAPKSPR